MEALRGPVTYPSPLVRRQQKPGQLEIVQGSLSASFPDATSVAVNIPSPGRYIQHLPPNKVSTVNQTKYHATKEPHGESVNSLGLLQSMGEGLLIGVCVTPKDTAPEDDWSEDEGSFIASELGIFCQLDYIHHIL